MTEAGVREVDENFGFQKAIRDCTLQLELTSAVRRHGSPVPVTILSRHSGRHIPCATAEASNMAFACIACVLYCSVTSFERCKRVSKDVEVK
jgi:hypothetical protein